MKCWKTNKGMEWLKETLMGMEQAIGAILEVHHPFQY